MTRDHAFLFQMPNPVQLQSKVFNPQLLDTSADSRGDLPTRIGRMLDAVRHACNAVSVRRNHAGVVWESYVDGAGGALMYRANGDNLRGDESHDETNTPSSEDSVPSSSTGRRSRQWTDTVQRLRPLSIDEAAKAARCRRGDIEKRIEQGDLPVIQRGSRRYIRQEDLQKMLENEAQVSPESARPKPGRNGHRAKMNPADIDPRLREFFD